MYFAVYFTKYVLEWNKVVYYNSFEVKEILQRDFVH